MKPVFSIITVTYNAEEFLERTIKSICEQEYPFIEYIIIDGLSTDATISIAEKYKDKISILLSEKDKGIYDAMNKGLALATGDYLWFMNAGDTIYEENTITKIVEQLNEQNTLHDIIYGKTAIVDKHNNFLYMRRLKTPENLSWRSFRNGMLVCHQAFIVKRNISHSYDMRYRFSADYDWCIRCMKSANNIHNTHIILSNYLNEGLTTANMKESLKERFEIMIKFYGKIPTYFQHIIFALRFSIAKLKGKL